MQEPSDWVVPGVFVAVGLSVVLFVRSCEKITVPEASGHMEPVIGKGTMKLAATNDKPIERFAAVAFTARGSRLIDIGRVLGMPGDTVEITTENKLVIKDGQGRQINTDQYSATKGGDGPGFLPYRIPSDCYFVVGDHRRRSRVSPGSYLVDSRRQGPIHRSLIVGTLSESSRE